jgi:hypothetical protein
LQEELRAVKIQPFDLLPIPSTLYERIINGPAERMTKAGSKLTVEPELKGNY